MSLRQNDARAEFGTVADGAAEASTPAEPLTGPYPRLVDENRMSAGESPIFANGVGADLKHTLADRAARSAVACSGCGQPPRDLAPFDAVAVTRALLRRCALLLHRREESLHDRGPEPGSWSAMEPAERVAPVLGAANTRLCDLLGEENLVPVLATVVPLASERARRSPSAVLGSLEDKVRRLVATIEGATASDWCRTRPGDGATPGEVVWLAVHDATHHVEDAELVLDGRVGGRPSPSGRRTLVQSEAPLRMRAF